MDAHIRQIDTRTADQELLDELSEFYVSADLDDMPEDPPQPYESRISRWRNVPVHRPEPRWIARDGAQIVGAAVVWYDTEQNLENGFARVHVHPDHRGQGHGKALARAAVGHLNDLNRGRVDTWIKEGELAETWADRLGMRPVYHEVRSRLRVDELDHALMGSWIERASQRASEYELRYMAAPYPDEILQDFCDLTFVMNSAPREDFEQDDEVLTPESWREEERSVLAAGGELHTLIAVHEPTGQFAGYTTINTQRHQPDLAWQWDTGVHPDHRNLGLGRWLKAALIERVTAEYPDLARVDTWNAGSNQPMLNINVEMGFRPVHISNTWQGSLDEALAKLGD